MRLSPNANRGGRLAGDILLGEEIEAMPDDDARRIRARFDEIVRRKIAERLGEDGTLRAPPPAPAPVDNAPRAPKITVLGTFPVTEGTVLAVSGAASVEEAADAIQFAAEESAFLAHLEAERQAKEKSAEEARLANLFNLTDRSSEKWPP
jgi:hypothetical protein